MAEGVVTRSLLAGHLNMWYTLRRQIEKGRVGCEQIVIQNILYRILRRTHWPPQQFTAEQVEEIQRIAEAIDKKYNVGAWQPGEISPSMAAPVLLDNSGSIQPELLTWGYRERKGSLLTPERRQRGRSRCSGRA